MNTAAELRGAISRLIGALTASGISYHMTGGIASSFYGEPRLTQDVDIVLKITPGPRLDQLLMALANQFLFDRQSVEAHAHPGDIFQVLDEETMIKVDFHVGEDIPGELSRSSVVELFPGLRVRLVAKEDAILSKLLWIKKGAHKSRQDVTMMLKLQTNLDEAYLGTKALELEVADLLKELRPKADVTGR